MSPQGRADLRALQGPGRHRRQAPKKIKRAPEKEKNQPIFAPLVKTKKQDEIWHIKA